VAIYLDTSVLVSAFVEDDHSDAVAAFLADAPDVIISRWAEAEFSSALGVRCRARTLDDGQKREAETIFDGWQSGQTRLRVDDHDLILCRRLIREGGQLRTPDALHLALVVRHGHALATLDQQLARAARSSGVMVIDL